MPDLARIQFFLPKNYLAQYLRIFSITKAIFEDKRGEKLDAEQREINQLIKVAHNAISYHYFSLSKDFFLNLLCYVMKITRADAMLIRSQIYTS